MKLLNYARGRRGEYIVRDKYKRRGYDVTRAAGSKGAADLIASNDQEIVFVQVGLVGKNVKAAREKMLTLRTPAIPQVRKVIWKQRADGSWDEIDLAIPF